MRPPQGHDDRRPQQVPVLNSGVGFTSRQPPALHADGVTGRWLRYPASEAPRAAEGGLRLQAIYRQSLPELPLVTVITVCRNVAATLRQAMASVFDQSYPNIEYLVIDGLSNDGTLEVVESFAERIDYYLSEADGGIYQAMNKGLALASGELVLMLNADDWYHPECVKRLVEARWRCGATVAAALAQYVDGDGRPTHLLRHMPFDASTRLRMPLRHELMLVPAVTYDQLGGYDTGYPIIADLEFTGRLYDAGCSLIEVPSPLLYFRETGISNARKDRLFAEREELMKRRFPRLRAEEAGWFAELPRLTPDHVNRLFERHGDEPALLTALYDYALDRRSLPAQKAWREAEGPFFTALDRLPKISVVLPLYNAEATVGDCLDSILVQSFDDFEIICIDDCSPDAVGTVVEGYRQRDPRIVLMSNERNLGLGATRNRGITAARGRFVFHVDPDDTLPPEALKQLYVAAVRSGSDMVKGSYLRGQFVHGQPLDRPRTIGLTAAGGESLMTTDLRRTPELLRSTEGHWSYLYRIDLARRVPYPNDLKMGQDSIFLVNALIHAASVSVIPDVVYHYNANPNSAMNTFTFGKYSDAIEWRSRACHALRDAGFDALAERMLVDYWGDVFFTSLALRLSAAQVGEVFTAIRAAFARSAISAVAARPGSFVRSVLQAVVGGDDAAALERIAAGPRAPGLGSAAVGDAAPRPAAASPRIEAPATQSQAQGGSPEPAAPVLKVATWSSFDHGGAGTGTQRRVASLRAHGVDARIFSLVKKSLKDYVTRLLPASTGVDTTDQDEVWREVRRHAIESVTSQPGYKARELFSAPYSALDLASIADDFDRFDIVHLHWVVGMLDFDQVGQCWADKPIVWTLADMNAFTGGCHYSEGCDGYKRECRDCPLLGAQNELAHQTWLTKKRAYDALNNVQIICPSKWLAAKAAESSLLGNRPVHYVPNAFPTDEFAPTNRTVARIRLGLPLDRKLLIFGADSLRSQRKGGDLLRESLAHLARTDRHGDIEVILFGNDVLDLPVKAHSLGFVSDPARLSLAYSAADAYLFPSREDNAPLTVGEALLCGTPVVAYPVGHVPDLVRHGETGYIARYCDPVDFAEGILQVLKMSERDPLGCAARAHSSARAFHDPERSVARHLEIYDAALQPAEIAGQAPQVTSRACP